MKTKKFSRLFLLVLVACVSVLATTVFAHCDTMSGPVAVAAEEALETGELKAVQIWVGQEQQEELKERFDECLAVRKTGAQAKKLADRYFIETAVRLHRQAEGMPFSGVKRAQTLPPDIAAAEKALKNGNVEIITDMLSEEIETQTKKWFDKAMEAKKHKDESVEAGREWVDSYVQYVVYVHTLHSQIKAKPSHGVGG